MGIEVQNREPTLQTGLQILKSIGEKKKKKTKLHPEDIQLD